MSLRKITIRLVLLVTASITLSQCAITQDVKPAGLSSDVKCISVVRNSKVHMEGLQTEIASQLRGMGYTVSVVDAPPAGNGHYLTFTANWGWDMAMWLKYFHADLHRGPTVVGSATYDARTGGNGFNKFGKTADKIRPLLKQLVGK
jgi:hypothetical protein